MPASLQEVVWYVLHSQPGKVYRLVDVVEGVARIRSGHIGSAAVNACLDRLIRSGEVVKFKAPSGASLFQAVTKR